MSLVVKIFCYVCDFCMYIVYYMKFRYESYFLNDLYRLYSFFYNSVKEMMLENILFNL